MAQPDRGERRRVRSQDGIEAIGVIGQLLKVTGDPCADEHRLLQVLHGGLLLEREPGTSSSVNQANHEIGATSFWGAEETVEDKKRVTTRRTCRY